MEEENLFQNTEVRNEERIKENKLLLKIWTEPKATLTYILNNCPDKYLLVLFALGGISRSIDRAATKSLGDHMSTASILLFSIIGGGLFGWLSYYFYAWLLEVTGKWIKGTGTFSQFKTVLAWSLVPTAFSLLLLIPELIVAGDALFKSEGYPPNGITDTLMLLFELIEATLGIWTLVIFIKGVSLIQNFNTGKAILNAILPVFLILIPILLLVLLIKGVV